MNIHVQMSNRPFLTNTVLRRLQHPYGVIYGPLSENWCAGRSLVADRNGDRPILEVAMYNLTVQVRNYNV
jgi:pyruvate/2-oxoglutarate/acetoin dehydrogenase E1 component